VEQTIKQDVAELTAMWVHAAQQWVALRKPEQRQTATGLRPPKVEGLNRICSIRRPIPASIASKRIVGTRATGRRKETLLIGAARRQVLAPTLEARITRTARHRPAQKIARGITVRDIQ
jgi:hypothetical protein